MLAGDGAARLVAWYDSRDGYYEIYAVPLAPTGERSGPEVRITSMAGVANWPSLAWDGDHFLVAWMEGLLGASQVWVNRLDSAGTPLGADQQLSAAPARRVLPFPIPFPMEGPGDRLPAATPSPACGAGQTSEVHPHGR